MINNSKIKKLYKQLFQYIKAVNSPFETGTESIFNINLEYIFNDSILFDKLIIGSNPLLNLLIIQKISLAQQKKKTKISIGLLITDDLDYWAYHQLLIPEVVEHICAILSIKKTNSISELMQYIQSNIAHEYINLKVLTNTNQQIKFCNNKKNVSIFHLNKRVNPIVNYSNKINNVINAEKDIKNNILSIFNSLIEDNQKITYTNENKSLIILGKEVYLSSLPNDWINMQSETIDKYTKFSHHYSSKSYGSAKYVLTDIKQSFERLILDITDIKLLN